MKYLLYIYNNGNEVLLAAITANLIAQWIKIIRYAFQRKKMNYAIMFATGGMPSSHSSTVTGMATTVGLVDGFSSTTFAIAALFAGVVMFDAAGVRRNAGRQAVVLNQIIGELLNPEHSLSKSRLKEFLGHSPVEVFAGALLGIALSFGIHFLLMHYVGGGINLIP